MRILFLSPRHCWPPVTGAKLREFYFARALGQRGALTHVSFYEPGLHPLTRSDLPFCEDVVSLPKPQAYSPLKIIHGLFGRWPLSVANYTTPEMANKLDSLMKERSFDIVHIDSIHMAAYVPALRQKTKALFIYDWHNIESELMFRYGQNVSSLFRKMYAGLTGARLARLERDILRNGSYHIVCSEREKIQLKNIASSARIEVIENGVDAKSFEEPYANLENRNRILFVGSMNYHANAEGVTYFARKVWPALYQQFPQWRLTLVGSNPSPSILALKSVPGVEVTGTVPDVRPYYRQAFVSIVPLRIGGGTRLKILEAMAAGVPVVSTPLGAEGLCVKPGAHILMAETHEDWARGLSNIFENADLRLTLINSAKELIRLRYDWEILGQMLFRTYCSWQDAAAQ